MITKLRARILEVCGPCVYSRSTGPFSHSQNRLAHSLGINQARLSQYATGIRKIPAHHLLILAEALDCSPVDLVGFCEMETV